MANWDAVRFCKDFNIPYISPGQSTKVTKGWIGVRCPNPNCKHNMDADFGAFNLRGGYYNCWSCGAHSLHQIIKWLLRIPNHEIQDLIWNYTGTISSSSPHYKKNKMGNAKKVIVPGDALKRKHKDYLESRGFDPDYLIDKYKLTAVGSKVETSLDRQYRNRIIIPIIDKYGTTISYQGRDITGKDKIRYKGCKIEDSVMNYKYTLYGLPFATSDHCCLVEGVVDQWNMGDGFLATFGIATTPQQIKEMSYFKRIFILFDPEKNAQESAQKIASKLAVLNRQVELIEMDGDKDPGELPEAEVKYIRRELGFV